MPSHYKDPINADSLGNSRKAGDANVEVKVDVVNKIVAYAEQHKLTLKDTANLIAISKLESGWNPDAAAKGDHTSASGVFQITDSTAKDALNRLSGKDRINGIVLGEYDRFNPNSNIEYGVAVYLDKKARAGSDDVYEIYKKYNSNPDEYTKYEKSLKNDSDNFLNALTSKKPITISSSDQTNTFGENRNLNNDGEIVTVQAERGTNFQAGALDFNADSFARLDHIFKAFTSDNPDLNFKLAAQDLGNTQFGLDYKAEIKEVTQAYEQQQIAQQQAQQLSAESSPRMSGPSLSL